MDLSKIMVNMSFDNERFMKDLKEALNDEIEKFCHYNLEDYIKAEKAEDKYWVGNHIHDMTIPNHMHDGKPLKYDRL